MKWIAGILLLAVTAQASPSPIDQVKSQIDSLQKEKTRRQAEIASIDAKLRILRLKARELRAALGDAPMFTVTTIDEVYLQPSPSNSTEPLAEIREGVELELVGEDGNWWKVNTQHGEGYVIKGWATPNKEASAYWLQKRLAAIREGDAKRVGKRKVDGGAPTFAELRRRAEGRDADRGAGTEEEGELLCVTARSLNLRAHPGLDATVKGKIHRRDLVRIMDTDGEWDSVRVVDGNAEGTGGWVDGSHIGSQEEAEANQRDEEIDAKYAKRRAAARSYEDFKAKTQGRDTPAGSDRPSGSSLEDLRLRAKGNAWTSAASCYSESPAVIRGHCEAKWPTDYRMQAYCIKQQKKAVAKLQRGRPSDIPGDVFSSVRQKCATKWTGDYRMMEYCERKQYEAYRELR